MPGAGAVTDVLTIATSSQTMGRLQAPTSQFGRGIAFALLLPTSLIGFFSRRRQNYSSLLRCTLLLL